jgi:hypothetical protein
VVRMNINNYMALYRKGDVPGVKPIGMFRIDPPIDTSRDNLIIAIALHEFYTKGVPVEETITKHTNIYDFCTCQKVSKVYSCYWQGVKQQRLNRYFVTKSGAYLYKSKDGVSMEHMMAGNSVQLFNDYYKAPMKDYNINYNYYIAETKKLINQLEPQQLSMF